MLLLSTLLATLLPSAYAFSFSLDTNTPGSCSQLKVEWLGGTPPFYLTILPAYDYPSNVSLPDSAYNNGSGAGEYAWTVNYPERTQLVAMMSDATGVGSGGLSSLITVGTASGASCVQRSTVTDFLFYLNETQVTQCQNVEIYWDKTATDPVTILGVIPGGQPFEFQSSSSNSLVWQTNVAAGTQFILGAFDKGSVGQGGSSSLLTVQGSSDSSCLDQSSPSSTPASPSSTATSSGTGGGVKTVTAIASAPAGAAGLSAGTIAGIAVAAVIAVLGLQAGIFWFCCRRQIRALLSHRKEMRGREVKPGGNVDLASASGASIRDDSSVHSMRRQNRLSEAFTFSSRHAGTRSSIGDAYEVDSSVSPFWDNRTRHDSMSHTSPVARESGPFDTPWDSPTPLDPPRLPHIRTDSLSSDRSIEQHLLVAPEHASSPSTPRTAGSADPLQPVAPYPQVPPLTMQASSSRTKAQMAAALSAVNRDDRDPLHGTPLPPQTAPPGGFRRHEDAGPLPRSESNVEDGVEDLPPMYNAEWESRDSGDGRQP